MQAATTVASVPRSRPARATRSIRTGRTAQASAVPLAQVLPAALAGERRALAELYKSLAPIVARVARRVAWTPRGRLCLGLLDEADLRQEILAHLLEPRLRVLRRWDATRGVSVEAFCLSVARNLAISVLRRFGRQRLRAQPLAETILATAPSVDDAPRQAARQTLRRLLPRLRGEYGAAAVDHFIAYLLGEHSGEELCALFGGLRTTTCYQRVRRFLLRARALLAEREPPAP